VALTPLIVRWYNPAESEFVLFGFAVSGFLSNLQSSWLEQVLYRFPIPSVARQVRRSIWLQAVAVLATALLLGTTGLFKNHGLMWCLCTALLAITDTLYRLSVIPLQMEERDRVFIACNLARTTLEFLFAFAVLQWLSSPVLFLQALILGRALSLLLPFRTSALFRFGKAETEKTWLRYGVAMLGCYVLLQLTQFGPQLFAVSQFDTATSTAFLASFRIYTSGAMLAPTVWLLYFHPRLLGSFQREGQEAFNRRWIQYWKLYASLNVAAYVLISLSYTFTAPLFLARYSTQGASALLAMPGILFLALAGMIQKFHEVTNQTPRMTVFMGIGFATFAVAASLMLLGQLPAAAAPELASAFTLAFAVYLALLCWDVSRMNTGSAEVSKVIRRMLIGSIVLIAFFTGLIVLFHFQWI
jgi:hypothetical protein